MTTPANIENLKNIPEEVEEFWQRIRLIICKGEVINDVWNYDYEATFFKIRFLYFNHNWKNSIKMLLDEVLESVREALSDFEEITALYTKKINYVDEKPTFNGFMIQSGFDHPGTFRPKVSNGFIDITLDEKVKCKNELKEELLYYERNITELLEQTFENRNEKGSSLRLKTGLSVDEIATLFLILNDYDDKGKRILNYANKTQLFKTIAHVFETPNSNAISVRSINTKYYSSDQIQFLDFWIEKFHNLSLSARRAHQETLSKADKPGMKRKKIK
jgi:hypothetical protein